MKFGVTVCKYGYTEVEADSSDEAMTIVDRTVPSFDISWDTDWSVVDATPFE